MARLPRLILPDVSVHVVQRGVDRQPCFRNDTDYMVYVSNLQELAVSTACAIHAYCLMTNHVHLLLTPRNAESCALLMRELGKRYVPYYNRRYGRTGTLWEGRFKSCLVETSEYVLACHRYIELNPVRAGMVSAPTDYRWSSYGGNAGSREDRLLSPHPEYLALGDSTLSRCSSYRALFDAAEQSKFQSAIRDATNGGYPLIGETLKSQLIVRGLIRRLERGKPGPRAIEDADMDQTSLGLGEFGT